jgi:hypothetical protein
MFISSDTKAFRFKTTIISSSFAVTSSETLYVHASWIEPKIGVGVRSGDGSRSQNLIRDYCRFGQFGGYRTGWSESTSQLPNKNWMPFDFPRSAVVHWERKHAMSLTKIDICMVS